MKFEEAMAALRAGHSVKLRDREVADTDVFTLADIMSSEWAVVKVSASDEQLAAWMHRQAKILEDSSPSSRGGIRKMAQAYYHCAILVRERELPAEYLRPKRPK